MGRAKHQTPKGSTEFWSKLWSEPVEHNRDSEWVNNVKEKLRDTPKQETVFITTKELKRAIARMSSWKAKQQDHTMCKDFCLRKPPVYITNSKQHLQECVNAGAVPTWMTE